MRIGIGIRPFDRRIPPELVGELRHMPRAKIEWLAELLALVAIVAQIVLLAMGYSLLPDTVPTHFGFSGLPDGYGGKGMLLMLLGVNIVIYVMMVVLSAFPQLYNFAVEINRENFRRQYRLARYMIAALKVLISWMFFYICYQTMAVAMGRAVGMGFGIWLFTGIILVGLPLVFILSYKWR